jgi:hypothetical protein
MDRADCDGRRGLLSRGAVSPAIYEEQLYGAFLGGIESHSQRSHFTLFSMPNIYRDVKSPTFFNVHSQMKKRFVCILNFVKMHSSDSEGSTTTFWAHGQ